ncbi:hypothetical protein BKA63DRAFT_219330 [Paraphoma chrysanthemicola]|nr:hypothetical protein BKA63DRAFT_219330 [Paraphoma chrysanthemicola]
MRQTIAFSSQESKRMRVAYTHDGKDVWIEYYLVMSTGPGNQTVRGYLYSSPGMSGIYYRLREKDIKPDSFIEQLNVNGVKQYQWRTHAYVLWKKEFGEATWRDEEEDEIQRQRDREIKEEPGRGREDRDAKLGGEVKRKSEDPIDTTMKRTKLEYTIIHRLRTWEPPLIAPTPVRRSLLARSFCMAPPPVVLGGLPVRPSAPQPRGVRYALPPDPPFANF